MFFPVQNFLKFSILVSSWSVEPAGQLEAGISEVEEQQGCAVRTTTNSSFTRERETQGQGLSPLSFPSQPWQKQHKHTHQPTTSQPGSYHLQDGNSDHA